MKKKLWMHEGDGHYIGSRIIVCASCFEDAEVLIKDELMSHALMDEPFRIKEIDLKLNSVILSDSGDY